MHIGVILDKYVTFLGVLFQLYRYDKFGFSTRNDPKLYEKLLETLRGK